MPIVPPRNASRRGPPAGGSRSRWRSKSPISPWTRIPGYSRRSSRGALAHEALGHVDGDEALERAGGVHRVQQQTRLGGAARAELDELDRAGLRDQLAGDALEDRALGARRVVLGELADLLEQLGAAGVVEVLGRELLELASQALADVLRERARLVGVERVVERRRARRLDGLAGHAATRSPAKIWRRAG